MRTIAATSLVSLSLLCAAPAWAVRTVDGGAIVDGASVTCAGMTTTPVSASSAIGVTVTVASRATLAVTGAGHLGRPAQNALFVANGMLVQIKYAGGIGIEVIASVINTDRIFSSGFEL